MTDKEFRQRIKSGKLGGCYIFAGEEDYLKRYYLGELRAAAVTDPTLAAFNHIVFDGQDVAIASLIEAVKAPPLFEEYKLVEWRYPSFNKMKESDLSAFDALVGTVEDYGYAALAIIVADGEIELGTEKRPSKLEKRFGERVMIMNFPRSTDAQLMSWLKRHFDKEGIEAGAESLGALIFRAGRCMDVLIGEVDKLSCYLKARGESVLSSEVVREVASTSPECDAYALSNAILDRNRRAAYIALDELKRERVDPVVIIGMMARAYSELATVAAMKGDGIDISQMEASLKMHPYKLKSYMRALSHFKPGAPRAILDELSRVDVGMKYGGVSGYTAIEMFISKCL